MEKEKSRKSVTDFLGELNLNSNPKSTCHSFTPAFQSQSFTSNRRNVPPPSLLSLCLGVVGTNLEDIMDDLTDIAAAFPSDIKMALLAIARRRKLLDDRVLTAFAECSWEILDLSDSNVSDSGLLHVALTCKNLKAVDISKCCRLTSAGISELLQHCHSLEILRWGGCFVSDSSARSSLNLLKPNIYSVEGESWEDLDSTDFNYGVQSLRWLVWPNIDVNSREILALECPRIVVNPKPTTYGFEIFKVPREALTHHVLDEFIVQDINPKTWAISENTAKNTLQTGSSPNELSIAEKFRLAFVERDIQLAPKRAKNARQNQRRAEKRWVMLNSRAKALALASQVGRSMNL